MAGQLDFEPYYDFQNPNVGITQPGTGVAGPPAVAAKISSRFELKNELDVLDSVDFKDIKYLSMSGDGWVD